MTDRDTPKSALEAIRERDAAAFRFGPRVPTLADHDRRALLREMDALERLRTGLATRGTIVEAEQQAEIARLRAALEKIVWKPAHGGSIARATLAAPSEP